MSKRRAEKQLTDRDDVDEEVDDSTAYAPGATFKRASAEVMAQRRIVSVKRAPAAVAPVPAAAPAVAAPAEPTAAPAGEAWPTFATTTSAATSAPATTWPSYSFSSAPASASWPSFITDIGVAAEKHAEAKAAQPKADETKPADKAEEAKPDEKKAEEKKDETKAEEKKAEEKNSEEKNDEAQKDDKKKDESGYTFPAITQPSFSFTPVPPRPKKDNETNEDADKPKEAESTATTAYPTFSFTPSAPSSSGQVAWPTFSGSSPSSTLFKPASFSFTPSTSGNASTLPSFDFSSLMAQPKFGGGDSDDGSKSDEGDKAAVSTAPDRVAFVDIQPPAPSEANLEEELPPNEPEAVPILEKQTNMKTGEEDETTLCTVSGKLYQFDAKEKAWKERGVGVMKVNQNKDATKSRLVMRTEATHLILLNAAIGSYTNVNRPAGKPKAVFFRCVEVVEEKPTPVQYSIRFMDEGQATTFLDTVKAQQDR